MKRRQRQAECLQQFADILKSDGVFVVDAFRASDADAEITDEGIRYSFRHGCKRRFYEVELLYPEVEDLDALATNAGLVLKERLAIGAGRRTGQKPAVVCQCMATPKVGAAQQAAGPERAKLSSYTFFLLPFARPFSLVVAVS
ncbi:MAG: hypothetical protein ABJB97_08075 [Acidobacteriota bacterium]